MRTKIGTRLLSLFLTAICVIGLIPTSAFAAPSGSMPSEITLQKSDYFLDTDGSKTYNSPSFGEPLYLHIINMNVGGETKIGFCAEHGKQLGNTLIGKKWGNPEPVTNSFIKMMIGYYYCMTDTKYQTDAYKEKWGGELWTDPNLIRYHNAWIQALCWRALGQGAAIPSDAEGQKVAIAKELMYIANAKNGTSYSDIYTDKYGTTTFYQKGEKVLDNTDCWPDVDVTLYHYIGGNATSPDGKKHYTNENTQAIMVATPKEPTSEEYQIVVKKVDSSNPTKGLAGAEFSLEMVGSDDPKFPMTGVTRQNGTYTFRGLKAGTYQVTETTAPDGYQIDNPGPYTVTLPTNGQKTVTVTALDTPITLASGSIRKVDKDRPTMGLAGATIRITGIDNNFTYEGQTVEGGALTYVPWDTMPVGSYVAEEIGAPEGYILPSPHEKKEFYWDKKNEVKLVFENDSKVKVQLLKKDESNNPLPGCLFTVIKNGQTLFSAVTDAAGTITVPNVTEGTYWFVEKDAPEGYVVNSEPVTAYVSAADIQGNKTVTVEATNHRKPGLEIVKIDSVTKKPVANCTFDIRSIDGTYHETLTTDGAGRIFLENMTPGSYEVKETAVPKGYNLNPEKQTVELTAGGTFTLTFENVPKTDFTLFKHDSNNHPIAGVTFEISKKGGQSLGHFTTDGQGKLTVPNLEPGIYVAVETDCPDDYILDKTPHEFQVNAGKTEVGIDVVNLKKPEITVKKVDSIVGGGVEGAKFEIFYAGTGGTGSPAGTYESLGTKYTDANGIIHLDHLKEGWYRFTEVEAPEGYQLDEPSTQEIYLKGDDNAELTFKDTPLSAIIVMKKDGVNGKALPGATFQLRYLGGTSGTGGTVIGEKVTDQNGVCSWTGLKAGTYIVEEVKPAPGYNIVEGPKTVYISGKAQDVITVSFDNSPDGTLLIKKVDAKNPTKVLAGAKFRVQYTNGTLLGNDNGIFTTDENGQITIAGLEPEKTIIVTEVEAPAGYIIDGQAQTIDIKSGKVVSITFKNAPKGELVIEKPDAATGKLLPGAEFRVTTAAGCEVGQNGVIGDTTLTSNGIFRTDADGKITISNLRPGNYIITEIKAPDGYLIDDPTRNVTVTAGDTQTIVFKNHSTCSLLIKKVCTENPDKMLEGAVFDVRYADGTVVGDSNGVFTTGADGTILITGLEANKAIVVTETKAPDGFAIDTTPQTITTQAGKVVQLTFANAPYGKIIIEKRDSKTNELLPGAEFRVTTAAGCEVGQNGVIGDTNLTSNGIFTTGADGKITITNVRPGSYVITEIKAPDGYLIDDPTRTITVTSGDTQTIVFKDTKPGGLIIEKRDSVTKEPLAGATFKVTTSDGRFVAQDGGATSTNGLYTTDANGQIHIVDLDPDTYVVTEVTAPDGYLMDAPSQTVKIEKNDTQTLTFYDTPLGGLTIVKVDSESGKRLEGAKIEVAKLNGEIVGTYVTDKLGVIQLPDLDDGWYQLTEIKAPKGYLLDSTPQKVEVKKGETKTFEFENTASASMLIHKIDSVTKKGIQGVKFVVYDSSMTPIGEYESDDQGYVHLNKTLEDGKYYVREIVAAEGYILDNKVKSFTVLAGDTAMIEWENTSELGQIQVIKTSEGYSSVNGLPAGTPLSGAIFAVYDKQNNVVDKFQTNENGIGSSKKLPLGIYTVKEVQAPANYGLNPTVFTADIEFAGQVVKLNVTDPVITAGVSIKKTGYAQTMNNNIMRWTVSGVRNDSTTSLQSFYWRDTLPTDAVRLTRLVTGTYSTTQTYKVTFTTNLNSQWRTAYDNLSTAKNYTLDMSSAALGLASNEYVTQFMLSFGIVPAGFHQLTNATVDAQTLYALTNGYKFTNKADVGGLLGGNWVQSIARWTTSIYSHYVPAKPAAPKSPKLPRTGY